MKKGKRGGKNKDKKKEAKNWLWQDVDYLLTPHEIPIILFVFSLVTLAIAFQSWSILFYSIVTIGVLITAHHLYKHNHRPHPVQTILATFFFPAILTFIAFMDGFSIALLILFLLSALSTLIIHYYHKKKFHPVRVMWNVTYSKVVSFTAVIFAIIVWAEYLPDYYMSVIEMLAVIGLPIMILFFFITKYLYLNHFDKKNWKHDIWLSARHAIIYGLAFVVIISGFYALSAVQLDHSNKETFSTADGYLIKMSAKIDESLDDEELVVYKEMEEINRELLWDLQERKNTVDERQLSFGEIIDDSYVQKLQVSAIDYLDGFARQLSLLNAKGTADKTKTQLQEIIEKNGTFPDGSTNLSEYAENLRKEVELNYTPYYMNLNQLRLLETIDNPATGYTEFSETGANWLFAYKLQMDRTYTPNTLIERQLFKMLNRLQLQRAFAAAEYKTMLLGQRAIVSGFTEQELYSNRYTTESDLSKAIRYTILKKQIEDRETEVIEI